MGKMFLIVVDSYSKWFEVEMMPSISVTLATKEETSRGLAMRVF